ncbi:MAG TPA: Eco57I restriction-modification methylase domain-containing protein, partial [Methanocellaceae archaeon]
MNIPGLFSKNEVLDRLDGDVTPEMRARAILAIEKMFDCKDMTRTVCGLLDSSSSFLYGNRARDAGVHYTPLPVATYICRRAIDSYLAHQTEMRSAGELSLEALHSFYFTLLKNIRVLDSSCGSGIFLEAALGELYRLRMLMINNFEERFSACEGQLADDFKSLAEDGELEYRLKKEIIADNLFGADIEPYSLEIASIKLKILVAAGSKQTVDFTELKVNLSCRNVLLTQHVELSGETFGSFDVIVGNPPYMRVKSMFSGDPESATLKKKFSASVFSSGLYHFQEGNLNLYKLFIERNLSLLRKNGSMGLIFPASFLNEATSEKLRTHLFRTCEIEELVEIPERAKIFGGVNQATVILFLNKSLAEEGGFLLRIGTSMQAIDNAGDAIHVSYKELDSLTGGKMEVPLLSDPALEWDMIKRLKRIPPFKGDNITPPIGTITVGQVDETIDKEFISEILTGDIFVKGIHLKEYVVDLSPGGGQPRWVRKEAFLKKRPSALLTISQPRIIGRNTLNKACSRRLKFALLPPGYLCGNSIKQVVMTDPGIDPLYLLALLNSSTLNWYFELFNDQNNIRNYSVEALPIIRASAEVQRTFAGIVKLLMGSVDSDREYLDKQILDPMVYELYFSESKAGLIEAVSLKINVDDPIQK